MIDPTEYIKVDTYEQMFKDDPNVYYCTTGEVHKFFEDCRNGLVGPCTLVTACCDFGIRLQKQNHPNLDVHKFIYAVDYTTIENITAQYVMPMLGPTCDEELCSPSDTYSIKIDRYTKSTFSEIPSNIKHWFSTNVDVYHPKISPIPFGLNNHGNGSDLLPNFLGRPKKGLLYINFQTNTPERLRLKQYYSTCPWVTFRESANLPVEQYLAELSEHKYVLSPFGNGLDCYRNYEAIYLRTIPVLKMSTFSTKIGQMIPTIQYEDLFNINPEFLEKSWQQVGSYVDLKGVTKSHVYETIRQASRNH